LIAVQLARELGPTLGRGPAEAVDRGLALSSAVFVRLAVWLGHDHVGDAAFASMPVAAAVGVCWAVDGIGPAVRPGIAATVQAARLALKNRTAAGSPNLA
jgi:hypothetical protein